MSENPYEPPRSPEHTPVRGPLDYTIDGDSLIIGSEVDLSKFCFRTGRTANQARLKSNVGSIWCCGALPWILIQVVAAGIAYLTGQVLYYNVAFAALLWVLILTVPKVRIRMATSKAARRETRRSVFWFFFKLVGFIPILFFGLLASPFSQNVKLFVLVATVITVTVYLARPAFKSVVVTRINPGEYRLSGIDRRLLQAIRNEARSVQSTTIKAGPRVAR